MAKSLLLLVVLAASAIISTASPTTTRAPEAAEETSTNQTPPPHGNAETTVLPETTLSAGEGLTMTAVAQGSQKPDDLSHIPEPVSSNSDGPEVYSLHVNSDVKYRYATTLVTSRVVNRGSKAAEVAFQFVLPENAFVSGFLIEVKGKVYKAYVKEKEEANREYQEAIAHGQTAAQVAVSARDSNLFAVSVNLEPRTKMTFNLTYEELLSRRLGVYDHVIHLVTSDKPIRDMLIKVLIDEPQNITSVKVPEPALDNEIGGTGSGEFIDIERLSPKSVLITYAPSVEQQQKLLNSKSKDNPKGAAEESSTQRLRVQYDVDHHSASGDILLHDGYFVHFFAPTENPKKTLHKHVIFVLDTSGSMWGRKIEQLQEAMLLILDSLKEDGDYFSLVQFSDNIKVWSPLDRISEDSNGIHLVTSQNIEKAKKYVKSMEAVGGTNIAAALRKGLQIAAIGLSGEPFRRMLEKHDGASFPQPLVIFLTDGEPTTGETRLSKILAGTRALNTEARAPIFSLAFGNDADFRFVKKLSLQNHAFARRIYEAADATLQLESFFQEVSSPLLNNVTFTYVNPKVDQTSLTESTFHTYFAGTEVVIAGKVNDPSVSSDDLGGVISSSSSSASMSVSTSTSDGETPSASSVTTEQNPNQANPAGETTQTKKDPESDKEHGSSSTSGSIPFIHDIIIPKFPPPRTPEEEIRQPEKGSLERLWAFLTIRQLLDKVLATEEEKDTFWDPTPPPPPTTPGSSTNSSKIPEFGGPFPKEPLTPKQKALKLALQYGFVTPLTSLVVVKPPEKGSEDKPHNGGVPESVDESKEKGPGFIQNKIVPVSLTSATNSGVGLSSIGFAGAAVAQGVPAFGFGGGIAAQAPVYGLVGAPGPLRPPSFPISTTSHYRPPPLYSMRPQIPQDVHLESAVFEEEDIGTSADRVDSPQTTQFSATTLATQTILTIKDIQWYKTHLTINGQLRVPKDGLNETLFTVDESHKWQENDTFGNCKTPSNQSGYCRHLSTCVQTEFIADYDKFLVYFCPIENNMVGVCCPEGVNEMETPTTEEQVTEQTTTKLAD